MEAFELLFRVTFEAFQPKLRGVFVHIALAANDGAWDVLRHEKRAWEQP